MESENGNSNEIQANRELVNKSLTSTEMDDCFLNMNNSQINSDKNLKEKSMLNVLSGIYAEFLVILAAVSVFIEVIHGPVPLFHVHVYFYFYLFGISIVIFITSFISRLIQKFSKEDENHKSEVWWTIKSSLSITRRFRFGLVVCGLAVLFQSCLGCVTVLIAPSSCLNVSSLMYFKIHFVFIVMQLAFFNMNPKKLWETINGFHNIFVFHLIATNAAMLFYTILWESSKDWQNQIHFKHNSSVKWGPKDVNIAVHSLEFDASSANQSLQSYRHVVHVTSNCWWRQENETLKDISSVQLCLQNSSVGMFSSQSAQYLYPVIVQYYIIVAFILYIVWDSKNIKCVDQNNSVLSQSDENIFCSFILSKGFFFGSIVFVISITFIVLNEIMDLNFVTIMSILSCVFGLALIVMLFGLFQIKCATKCTSFLNQNFVMLVQRCGLYFIYSWCAFNIFVSFLSEEKFSLFLSLQSLLMILHAVIQYIFIDQICTVSFQSSRIRSLKPIIIFLILSNASLWIFECFILWNNENVDIQLKIYGNIFWSFFKRIVLPCLAFYRFHSAALLTQIWKIIHVEFDAQNNFFK